MEENFKQDLPVFPKATSDGFSFLSEDDETMGVETQEYENGNLVKRVTLKKGNKAVVRELKAWEVEESQRFHKNNQELLFMAIAAKCVKIDDKNLAFEDVKNLRASDWVSIKAAVSLLNFL